MMSKRHIHKCTCCFIPPHALEALARQGVAAAREGVLRSTHSRTHRQAQKRKITVEQMLVGSQLKAAAAADGSGRRIVYDCANNTEQRKGNPILKEPELMTCDDPIANKVFDFAGNVRDFFSNVLQRDSIDNAGMELILNVHYGKDYMNAFWDGDEMTFGDGDGEIFTSFGHSLDVVAHELAHGVTQFTANLEYDGQSGALNEHFSDVFGTAITQYVSKQNPTDSDWLIGDEIMGPKLFGEALRSMKSPGEAYDNSLLGVDPQPSHMSKYYDGSKDNHGVHINSGIPNRAFYLVASTIGTIEATKIWYRGLQNLWPTAQFADAVDVLVSAAKDLTRDNVVPAGSTQAVRSAFKDVGLG